ncbi:hypothetical protein GGR51DRAFT_563815 [Nemania sp. FL0031]|nr:hypothetical protein GGR51DRAFT_563815 [Nemania sp. FL0031]
MEDQQSKIALGLIVKLCENEELRVAANRANSLSTDRVWEFRRIFHGIINNTPTEQITALKLFMSRAWFSRVWILQEAVLAPNIVAQCSSQLLDFEALLKTAMDIRFADAAGMLRALASTKRKLEEGKMPVFDDVMALASKSQSTDPRDKIYGVLAITAEFQPDSEGSFYPDYTSQVPDVFVKATSRIANRQNLGFLRLVCPEHQKSTKGLPSWCPDYTRIGTGLVALGSKKIRDAVTLEGHQSDIKVVGDRLLVVHGFCYDAVDKVAHDMKGLLGLTSNMSGDQWMSGKRGRIETLWRTLIQDEFYNIKPAPKAVGLFFSTMVAVGLGFDKTMPEDQGAIDQELSEWSSIISNLLILEPESRPLLPNVEWVNERRQEHLYTIHECSSIPQRAHDAGLMKELRQLLRSALANTSDKDLAMQVLMMFQNGIAQKLINVHSDTCFFTTKLVQRCSVGDSSAQTGDQVWILQGAWTPVLLRPLENGNYAFVGVLYIQDMTNDEIKDVSRKQEIQRVSIE